MIAQGLPPVAGSAQDKLLGLRLPNTGPVSHCAGGGGVRFPTWIVPGPGAPLSVAPVGMLGSPKLLLNARNVSQFTASYITPAPPRSTVLPSP